jgi:GNAT superfamily N-acetyltransferase
MMDECGLSANLREDWKEITGEHYAQQHRAGLCLHHGAFEGGRLVGTAGALVRTGFPFNTLRNKAGWIMDVYVLPDYRGRRLAGRLTQISVEWLRSQGATDIRLVASRQARECGLYEKLGFTQGFEMRLPPPAT